MEQALPITRSAIKLSAGRLLGARLGASVLALGWTTAAFGHGVSGGDAQFLAAVTGVDFWAYLYLGAKHMVTGYDHLLFLLGVIFFLRRLREVALYVTLFSLGHSITLLSGVLGQIHVSPFLVDAVIGLSVVYKAFDNLGGFGKVFGFQPDQRIAVLLFGLVHGFGLATKLQDIQLAAEGLVPNMLAFNLGVELGQMLALAAILIVMGWWRSMPGFSRHAASVNVVLMAAGFILFEYQLVGFFAGGSS